MGHVEEQRSRGVRNIGGEFPCQAQAHEILGQQEVRRPLVDLRFVLADPKKLGRAEAGERGIRDELDELFRADARRDPIALRLAALVTPDQRRVEDSIALVEKHHAVHLAGESHGGDVFAAETRPLEHGADSLDSGLPPVLGVLLGPAGLGHPHGLVVAGRGAHHVAVRPHDHRARARRADVDAHEVGHEIVAPGFSPADVPPALIVAPGFSPAPVSSRVVSTLLRPNSSSGANQLFENPRMAILAVVYRARCERGSSKCNRPLPPSAHQASEYGRKTSAAKAAGLLFA